MACVLIAPLGPLGPSWGCSQQGAPRGPWAPLGRLGPKGPLGAPKGPQVLGDLWVCMEKLWSEIIVWCFFGPMGPMWSQGTLGVQDQHTLRTVGGGRAAGGRANSDPTGVHRLHTHPATHPATHTQDCYPALLGKIDADAKGSIGIQQSIIDYGAAGPGMAIPLGEEFAAPSAGLYTTAFQRALAGASRLEE